MVITELELRLQTVYQTLFENEALANGQVEKNWLNVIQPFLNNTADNGFPFFLFVEEVDDTVEFMISIRNGDLFRAKKQEINSCEDFTSN